MKCKKNANKLPDDLKQRYSPEKVREIENLCAYFLSQVICTAKKSFEESKNGKERLKNKIPEWSANLGVPVKYADSPVLAYFHRVLHLALFLSNQKTDNLTYGKLKKILQEPRSNYIQQFNLEDHLENLDLKTLQNFVLTLRDEEKNTVLSELEAIIRPLDNVDGTYFVFDIGGGTVDATSCYLRAKGEPDFYYTSLKEYGINTLPLPENKVFEEEAKNTLQHIEDLSSTLCIAQRAWTTSKSGDYRSNKYKTSKEAVEEKLKSNIGKEKPYLEMILCQQKIHQQVGDVVISTKRKIPSITGLRNLSFVLVGGGAKSPFYKDTIMTTWKCFKQENATIPQYEVRFFENPRNKNKQKGLDMNGIPDNYFDRYLVAFGLCILDSQKGRANFPSGFKIQIQEESNYKQWDDNDDRGDDANKGTGRLP
ncbi:hypothetical protein ACN4EE_11210 [Geminocystis sp. CENA526]|uniref:hypothetical protein n=1 Tax=Geminocystis sp. CENA526 TaxID=1355871 RepID=UPI003D6FDE68